jgi:agmatinase
MRNDEEFVHSGIATFMRAPHVGLEDAAGYDVVVLGVPLDYGVSFRAGQRHGPRAIREATFWHRLEGGAFVDLASGTRHDANALTVADLGDVVLWPADPDRNTERITQTVGAARAAAFPVVLGGDHSITYAAFLGCQHALAGRGVSPIGLLHFDAHLDVEREYLTLPPVHHGNFLGELVRQGHLRGEHVVSIGGRGIETQEGARFLEERRITLFGAGAVRTRGLPAVVGEACSRLAAQCAAVYVTFDVDVIDPAQAPGTGTPVVGGLAAEDVLAALPVLKGLRMAAFDLVEVCPPLDPSGATAIVAAEVLWQVLSFGIRAPS